MIDYLSTMDTETGVKAETNIEDEVKIDYEDLETISNNTLLPDLCLVKNSVLEEIAHMIKFDIIQSSLPVDLAAITINQEFLTSAVN